MNGRAYNVRQLIEVLTEFDSSTPLKIETKNTYSGWGDCVDTIKRSGVVRLDYLAYEVFKWTLKLRTEKASENVGELIAALKQFDPTTPLEIPTSNTFDESGLGDHVDPIFENGAVLIVYLQNSDE